MTRPAKIPKMRKRKKKAMMEPLWQEELEPEAPEEAHGSPSFFPSMLDSQHQPHNSHCIVSSVMMPYIQNNNIRKSHIRGELKALMNESLNALDTHLALVIRAHCLMKRGSYHKYNKKSLWRHRQTVAASGTRVKRTGGKR